MISDVDESAIVHKDPETQTLLKARAKTTSLLPFIREPALLITSDIIAVCNGKVCEKPRDAEEVRSFYRDYALYPVETINAVVATNTATGERREGIDRARVHFKPVPEEVVEAMRRDGALFGYAGAFTIWDPLLADHIGSIEGEPESIEGLPKALTQRFIRELMIA